MQICLATTNPHKLDEVRAVFDQETDAVVWSTLAGLPTELAEPEEDQDTFEGNALLKARYYAKHTGQVCLADDSGIEVDALGGRPGVKSARYSGATGPRAVVDPANNAKLLEELAARDAATDEQRKARYVCAMSLVVPAAQLDDHPTLRGLLQPGDDHVQITVRGELPGRILHPAEAADPANPAAGRGTNGFGYDPLVVLHDGRTAAEFTPEQKNAVSHRGDATRSIVKAMRTAGLFGS